MSAPICIKLGSIAASGTASVTIPVSGYTQEVRIYVVSEYAAVAATSGVTAAFQVSPDGSTFSNSNAATITVAAAANTIAQGEQIIKTMNEPFRQDGGPLEAVKVNLTNLDATNAASVMVFYQAVTYNK